MEIEFRKLEKEKKFEPLIMEMKIESLEELMLLYHVFNIDSLKSILFAHYGNIGGTSPYPKLKTANKFNYVCFEKIRDQIKALGYEDE